MDVAHQMVAFKLRIWNEQRTTFRLRLDLTIAELAIQMHHFPNPWWSTNSSMKIPSAISHRSATPSRLQALWRWSFFRFFDWFARILPEIWLSLILKPIFNIHFQCRLHISLKWFQTLFLVSVQMTNALTSLANFVDRFENNEKISHVKDQRTELYVKWCACG